MRQHAQSAPTTRSFLAAFLVAALSGAAYGLLEPTFATFERIRTSVTRIEKLGQDVNGDGIATTVEGTIDLDGDGRFGELEAAFFGLDAFIEWNFDGVVDETLTELHIQDSCCVKLMGPVRRPRVCLLYPPTPGVVCVTSGVTCKTQ